MATQQKLKEEFLTCIVCHEVFRDPVTLHCGHTFCIQCVTAYTKTQKQAIGEKSLPCPHCRGLTKVPDPSKSVDEWASQIKTGFFVQGLVDAVVTDVKDGDVCASCQEDGETVPAVFWCSDCGHGLCSGCEKYHRKLPLCKEHAVMSLSGDNRQPLKKPRKRITCPKHPDTVIDMFCEDCDVAVCHRCCILHHRKCDSVITLEECLPKLKSVVEDHRKQLDDVVKDVNQNMYEKMTQVEELEQEFKEAITAIDVCGEKIIAEVREQQKDLKKKVNEAKDEILQNLKGCIKSGQMRLEEAQQRQGLIQKGVESDIIMNYYEMYKICKPLAARYTDNAQSTHKTEPAHIKVEDESDRIISMIKERSLASLITQRSNKPSIGVLSKPELVKKIDTGLGGIFDMLVMSVNSNKVVVATSCNKNCVASFYETQGRQCRSHLELTNVSYNVCQISANKCAVTVLRSREIELIVVTPDLKRERTLSTSKRYLGLTCISASILVASTEHPGVVDILDMSGSVLRSFGSEIFTGPAHLANTKNNIILISDYDRKSVTGITDKGEIRFKNPLHDDMKLTFPRGIGISTCGEIFVADERSNRIVMLTDTGEFVREVLSSSDGVNSPRALFVDEDNLMYVSVDHTTIHVYEFK